MTGGKACEQERHLRGLRVSRKGDKGPADAGFQFSGREQHRSRISRLRERVVAPGLLDIWGPRCRLVDCQQSKARGLLHAFEVGIPHRRRVVWGA